MADLIKNPLKVDVTPSSGKDFRDTNVTDGLTKKSSVANEKNSVTEYVTPKAGGSDHGGMAH